MTDCCLIRKERLGETEMLGEEDSEVAEVGAVQPQAKDCRHHQKLGEAGRSLPGSPPRDQDPEDVELRLLAARL